jgi:ParB family transcriptional regulator, chromosome partitioning protein
MSKLKVENRSIDDIKESNYNSRIHSEAQIEKIAASIGEFGFLNPIIIDEEDEIIAGHGRFLAAKHLNIDEVPTIRLTHLTDDKKRAFIIADNKIALSGEWDYDILKEEFDEIIKSELSIDLLGFNSKFIDSLFKEKPADSIVVNKLKTLKINFDSDDYDTTVDSLNDIMEKEGCVDYEDTLVRLLDFYLRQA